MAKNLNEPTTMEITVEGLRRWGLETTEIDMPVLYAIEDLVTAQRKKTIWILTQLKASLPVTIRNTPHSCHTDEHCCALHAAHRAAAEKVEKLIQDEIDKLEYRYAGEPPEESWEIL